MHVWAVKKIVSFKLTKKEKDFVEMDSSKYPKVFSIWKYIWNILI